MRDSQYGVPIERSGDELSTLARAVAARLAARGGRALRQVDPDLVFAISRAVASVDPALYDALRPEFRRARISDTDLVDSYFPAVARLLGCDWAEDRAGWAEVTIGLARLQSLVHQISLGWDGSTSVDGASVLVVLPEGEQHSFGAQVLAGQLRRQGISVHLQIGTRLAVLRSLVQERQYDCAMVSVGCEEKLEPGRKIVKALKEASGGRLWVAVGGAVLERVGNAAQLTGADIATSDPVEALAGAQYGSTAAVWKASAITEAADRRLVVP
jgi:methylmalonyl-CoA mutase cobalamin-binding subunit